MAKTFEQLVPAPEGRFDGISRPYSPAEVERLRGSVPIAYTLAEKGANRLWEFAEDGALRQFARRRHRQPGDAEGRAPVCRRSICPAGRSPPTPTPPARCIPTSASIRPMPARNCAAASTAPSSAPTRSSMPKAAPRSTGSCRSWPTRKPASAVRSTAFEIMKAYIEAGAAGVHFEDQLASREEVRPPGRQGADPDRGACAQPDRGASRRRRLRRADRSCSRAPTPKAPS